MSIWKQKSNSLIDPVASIGTFGLEPLLWGRAKPKDARVLENVSFSEQRFMDLFGKTMPGWWPRHEDGTPVTHLYRLIDERYGSDLIHPPSSTAMSHRLHIQYNLI